MSDFNIVKEKKIEKDGKTKNQIVANTQNIEELIERFLPEGTMVKYAFFASYDGMSLEKLYTIIMSLPGGNRMLRDGKFDAVCGAKNDLADKDILLKELLLKKVSRELVQGSFHPKIYLIKYGRIESEKEVNTEPEGWLLILGSKNITRSSYLDAFVLLKGQKPQKESKLNGSQLYNIIKSYKIWENKAKPEELEGLKELKELEEIEFRVAEDDAGSIDKVSFWVPNGDLFNKLIDSASEKYPLYVVSPFVRLNENQLKCLKNVRLFSTKTELEKINLENSNIEAYYLIEEEKKYPNSLHGKIYICHGEDKTSLYIGSANFTSAAFNTNKNKEILAEICYEDKNANVYKELIGSFEEDINNEYWQTFNLQEKKKDDSSEVILVPCDVYKYIQDNLKIINITSLGKEQWKYGFCEIPQYEMEPKEENGQKVTITFDINPKSGLITQDGWVNFEYKDKTFSYSFDIRALVEKQEDDNLKKEYEKALQQEIDTCISEQKKKLFAKGRAGGTGKSRKAGNSKTYRAVADEGLYEAIKKIAASCASIEDESKRKECIKTKTLKMCNQLVAELTEDEKKLLESIGLGGENE